MMLQEQEHTAFLQGLHKYMGKGPSITQIAAKDKKDQRKRSRDYQQEFREKDFQLCDGQNEGISSHLKEPGTGHLINFMFKDIL